MYQVHYALTHKSSIYMLLLCVSASKIKAKETPGVEQNFCRETTTSNLWNWMNLSCLPNGIKLYWLQFAEKGACVKGMDTDVTVLKRHPYISPRKHSGEHPVGTQWAQGGWSASSREGLTKPVWEGVCTVCAHEVEHCLKFSPPTANPHV